MGSHNESNAKKEKVTPTQKIILGGNINNIKSKYILQKIFDNINKVRFLKSLNIMKTFKIELIKILIILKNFLILKHL